MRLNANVSPRRRVTITDDTQRAMGIDGSGYGRLQLDVQQPPPDVPQPTLHPNASTISSITPSLLFPLADTPMADASSRR